MRCQYLLLLAIAAPVSGQEQSVVPLPQSHAHNDYRHDRPLLDALERGFCSVEADIFLVEGRLLVGHGRDELKTERTLETLYLDPLQKRVKQNGGRVYPDGPTITLLVDIKENGPEVYTALRDVLTAYEEMLCRAESGVYHEGAIQVVISGDRPVEDIMANTTRYVGIDGRLSDLESSAPAHLMPLISDRWTSHFTWRGVGEFPAAERNKLQSIVRRAHASGRRVRFWATPESPRLWKELLAAEVDHINTDRLDSLREFLQNQ
jgi:hypothetical protein